MILPVSSLDRQFINSALSFFYDLFVIVLTLRKSYSHVLDMRRFGLGQHSVAQVLLRDGKCLDIPLSYFLANRTYVARHLLLCVSVWVSDVRNAF